MKKKFENAKSFLENFKNEFKSKLKKNKYLNNIKFNLNLQNSENTKYQEVRYKPIPKWTKSLQWTIVGFISLGFLYSLIARIDEVVISQGDLESQGAERPIKAPVPGIVSTIVVKEGELVKKNQILLEFDTEINNERLNSLLAQHALEKSNLSEEVKLYKFRRNILSASITAAEEILKIEKHIANKMETIVDEGAISQLELLQKKQNIINIKSEINQNKEKLNENQSQYLKNSLKIRSDISSIERQIFETKKSREYESFKSPIVGYVFDLVPSSAGYAATAGETLLKIVPTGEVQAKVFVSSADVGFLRKNMEAEVRVSAYPFTQFGSIKGKLTLLGREVIPGDQINPEPRFPVIVTLEKQYLEKKGKKYKVSAGQTVVANFVVRSKPVISLLTDSAEKAFDSLRGIKTDQP